MSQYWLQQRGEISGPFSLEKLKQMAAARKILPNDKISSDQRHWVVATRFPGLMSLPGGSGRADEPESSGPHYLAETVADDDDIEYRLSEPEEVPEPPHEPRPDELKPAPEPLPAGTLHRIEIPQAQLGVLIGAAFTIACFFTSLAVLAASDVAGLLENKWLTLIPVGVLVAGGFLVLLGGLGTSNTIELQTKHAGGARLIYTRRFAFVPWSVQPALLAPGDRLEKRIKQSGGIIDAGMPVDMMMLLMLVLCCAVGAIPGLVFWLFWWRARQGDSVAGRFRLLLYTREHPGGLLLMQQRVENYFATRYGTPAKAEEIINLLTRAVPELPVGEVEE